MNGCMLIVFSHRGQTGPLPAVQHKHGIPPNHLLARTHMHETRVWTWFGPDRSSVCARIPCWQGSQWAQYHNDSRRECAHSEEPLWHLQPEQEQGSPPTTTLPYPGSHRDPDSASPGIYIRARAALVCKYAFIDAWVYFMQQQEGPCEAHSTCQHKQREVKSQRLPAQHEEIIEPSLPVGLPSALHLLPYFSDQRLSLSNTQEKAHTYTHGRLWQCCDLHTVCTNNAALAKHHQITTRATTQHNMKRNTSFNPQMKHSVSSSYHPVQPWTWLLSTRKHKKKQKKKR